MDTLLPCPRDVRDRARVLYCNGLTGFQEPAEDGVEKDRFILCWLHEPPDDVILEERIERVRQSTGTFTVRVGTRGRHHCVSLHWTEYGRRYHVLTEMLRRELSFHTQTKHSPFFDCQLHPEFTQELLERRATRVAYHLYEDSAVCFIDQAFFEEWNYVTQHGLEFCRILWTGREYWPERTNYLETPLFADYDPLTLLAPTKSCMCLCDDVCQQCQKKLNDRTSNGRCIVCKKKNKSEGDVYWRARESESDSVILLIFGRFHEFLATIDADTGGHDQIVVALSILSTVEDLTLGGTIGQKLILADALETAQLVDVLLLDVVHRREFRLRDDEA